MLKILFDIYNLINYVLNLLLRWGKQTRVRTQTDNVSVERNVTLPLTDISNDLFSKPSKPKWQRTWVRFRLNVHLCDLSREFASLFIMRSFIHGLTVWREISMLIIKFKRITLFGFTVKKFGTKLKFDENFKKKLFKIFILIMR